MSRFKLTSILASAYKHCGIPIAGLVRHVANAFKFQQNNAWEWIDQKRYHQTSPAIEIKPN